MKVLCTEWSMSESFSPAFHYYKVFKVKHPEKMFSRYLLFVYYLLDFSPIKWSMILSNLCKTNHSIDHFKVVGLDRWCFANNHGGLLLMALQGKSFFVFLNPYTEWYALKAVPQRCSTTKVFCKYAASLLEITHAEI